MNHNVPFLTEAFIEQDAALLLSEFERARGVTLKAPIPIEDIIEKHLRLRIDLDDLHERFGKPRPANGGTDVLGAIYGDGTIFIDQSLDPETFPDKEARFRFTLGHEGGGHWRLHQSLIRADAPQLSFLDDSTEPKFLCRKSNAKAREEWQADFYSSCALMPRKLLFEAWSDQFEGGKPQVLHSSEAMGNGFVEVTAGLKKVRGLPVLENEDETLERVSRPLADRFLVSPSAMRIRLEHVGLLHRKPPAQSSFDRT